MARVVCVHGIGQEREVAETLLSVWAPALSGGVNLAGGELDASEIAMASYGHLFRPEGKADQEEIPEYAPGDVEEDIEEGLLNEWGEEASRELGEADRAKGELLDRSRGSLLQLLARTPFFGDVAQKVVIWYLKQVRRYLTEPETRNEAQRLLLEVIERDTQVVVGHSLGSVIAYEALSSHSDLPPRTFVTLGSPLGLLTLGPCLVPEVVAPNSQWPPGIRRWFNVADKMDVVALEKRLSAVFGPDVTDSLVHNGATMHNIKPYLTAKETGMAIWQGLKE